ncbi:MAG: hypothetical protein SGILL_001392, partial [Bacillariaceae sp.]
KMSDTNSDAARKRRIAVRNSKRCPSPGEPPEAKRLRVEEHEDDVLAEPVTSKPKPHITGIKKQSRYDPGVPMNREELKAWRKEARRVRNRESAAASRKKNREQVTELQEEVDSLKTKYAAALKLIIDLEASRSLNDCATFTPPSLLRQDLMEAQGTSSSRPSSPGAPTVSPPLSPATEASASGEDMFFGASLPLSAKILPGADANHDASSSTEADMMMNGDKGNYGMTMDEWNTYEAEKLASVSDSGSSSGGDEQPIHHEMDDSALGEFLMDTFQGVDMSVMDDIELAAI